MKLLKKNIYLVRKSKRTYYAYIINPDTCTPEVLSIGVGKGNTLKLAKQEVDRVNANISRKE